MLHDMACASKTCIEVLPCERAIRRAEIDMLLDCSMQTSDRDAQLLAEVLLPNHHWYMPAATAAGEPDSKFGPGAQDKRSVVVPQVYDCDTLLPGSQSEAMALVRPAVVELFDTAPDIDRRGIAAWQLSGDV